MGRKYKIEINWFIYFSNPLNASTSTLEILFSYSVRISRVSNPSNAFPWITDTLLWFMFRMSKWWRLFRAADGTTPKEFWDTSNWVKPFPGKKYFKINIVLWIRTSLDLNKYESDFVDHVSHVSQAIKSYINIKRIVDAKYNIIFVPFVIGIDRKWLCRTVRAQRSMNIPSGIRRREFDECSDLIWKTVKCRASK